HEFLYMPDCPIPLLGRDLLSKLRAQISFDSDGQTSVSFRPPTSSPKGILSFCCPLEEEWRLHQSQGQVDLPLADSFQVSGVWAEDNPPGLARNIPPVHVDLLPNARPIHLRQYPIPRKALEGIQAHLNRLLSYGIIRPCQSPWNTPLLPVQKPGTEDYRPVQDLRVVNKSTISLHPVVPNPCVLLGLIPSGATHFITLDLKDAFFCIRVAPASQLLFAFQWENPVTGRKLQYTWTRLPQGFKNSPTIFGTALGQDLKTFKSEPSRRVLLQYVDDLLIAAVTQEECFEATRELLELLLDAGYKVSRSKAQLCQSEVKYLGFCISQGSRRLDVSRKQAVAAIPQPKSRREVREFLGAAGFCRIWIPNFALMAKPLYQATKGGEKEPFEWGPTAQQSFIAIKKALLQAPALGLPDVEKPFSLYVHERQGVALGVLTQMMGSWQRPVAYLSKQLDGVAKGWPACMRAIAATALLVQEADKLTLGQELVVKVPHAVLTLMEYKGNHWFTNNRMVKYQASLCENPRIHLETVATFNPATLLPASEGPPDHDCIQTMDEVYSSRPDLKDVPWRDPDVIYFTDGSSYVENSKRLAGYAVVTEDKVIEARALPQGTSAQKAELVALIRALELAAGLVTNIYTDSKYAFTTLHAHGALYKEKGLINAAGQPVKYGPEILQLLEAVWAPKKVAVIHCRGHQRIDTPVARGNRHADRVAKEASLVIDFTEMPRSGRLRYLLVMVCTFSGWVEAYPTVTEKATEVARALLRDVIPRYGLPLVIGSDNGPAFVEATLQALSRALRITWKLHCAYRPQSSGQVERANRTLKNSLAKICQETQLKWPQALPLALFRLRCTPTKGTALSPFEIVYGKPPAILQGIKGDIGILGSAQVQEQVALLGKIISELQSYVREINPVPFQAQVHSFLPGDRVWVKDWKLQPLGPRWKGPFTVLLSTPAAVKVAGITPWVHWSR
ncbi:uncharacterized protein LOC115476811, partial [Microcaecilia unicolor]|uniref:Gag-Pol polyprotein n=1 Tax=Microcaecilia unicolor TaxID=1415580 RepID=A0A6P7YPR1_9AMPH